MLFLCSKFVAVVAHSFTSSVTSFRDVEQQTKKSNNIKELTTKKWRGCTFMSNGTQIPLLKWCSGVEKSSRFFRLSVLAKYCAWRKIKWHCLNVYRYFTVCIKKNKLLTVNVNTEQSRWQMIISMGQLIIIAHFYRAWIECNHTAPFVHIYIYIYTLSKRPFFSQLWEIEKNATKNEEGEKNRKWHEKFSGNSAHNTS